MFNAFRKLISNYLYYSARGAAAGTRYGTYIGVASAPITIASEVQNQHDVPNGVLFGIGEAAQTGALFSAIGAYVGGAPVTIPLTFGYFHFIHQEQHRGLEIKTNHDGSSPKNKGAAP